MLVFRRESKKISFTINYVMSLVLGLVQPVNLHEIPRNSAPYRDGQRVRSLHHVLHGRYLPVHTIEKNYQQPQKRDAHPFTDMSKRGADDLHKSLNVNFQFKLVFADYIRFPRPYYRLAYKTLLQFLKRLKELDRLAPDVRVYIPIQNHAPIITIEKIMDVFGHAQMINNEENPLFYATDRLETIGLANGGDKRQYLGGVLNSEQMSNNYSGFACGTINQYTPWTPDIKSATMCKQKCRLRRCGAINRKGRQCCLCVRSDTGLCHHHRK